MPLNCNLNFLFPIIYNKRAIYYFASEISFFGKFFKNQLVKDGEIKFLNAYSGCIGLQKLLAFLNRIH